MQLGSSSIVLGPAHLATVVLLGQLSLPEHIRPALDAVSPIARSPVAVKTPPVLPVVPVNPSPCPFPPCAPLSSIPFSHPWSPAFPSS